jgi:predicted RNA-binding protein with PUA-like domain
MTRYWLMKSEPCRGRHRRRAGHAKKTVDWWGVRNYQARNFMRDQMQVGDGVLFYHSSCPEPGIAGLAEVAVGRLSRPHPVRPEKPLFRPEIDAGGTALDECRCAHREEDAPGRTRRTARPSRTGQHARAARGNRLSITPVDPAEWKFITGKLIGRKVSARNEPLVAGLSAARCLCRLRRRPVRRRRRPDHRAAAADAVPGAGFPGRTAMHLALGTSMATIVLTSDSSMRAHHGHGAVRWDIVKSFAPGLMAGTFGGSFIRHLDSDPAAGDGVHRHRLLRLGSMLLDASPSRTASCPEHRAWWPPAPASAWCRAWSPPAAAFSRFPSWCSATW